VHSVPVLCMLSNSSMLRHFFRMPARLPDLAFCPLSLHLLPLLPPRQKQGGSMGQKMQLLAAERKLEAARQELRAAEADREAFAEETAEGPPASPSRQARPGGGGRQQLASAGCWLGVR
jgi:hypothetical protein